MELKRFKSCSLKFIDYFFRKNFKIEEILIL